MEYIALNESSWNTFFYREFFTLFGHRSLVLLITYPGFPPTLWPFFKGLLFLSLKVYAPHESIFSSLLFSSTSAPDIFSQVILTV